MMRHFANGLRNSASLWGESPLHAHWMFHHATRGSAASKLLDFFCRMNKGNRNCSMHACDSRGWVGYRLFKRTIDVVVSLVLLNVMLPVFALIALLIKLDDGGPMLYIQRRVGCNGAEFDLYKFRSMTNVERKVHSQTYDASEGVTRIGKYLRRLKLDEVPQLFNVLRGDLSLVGPRPCLPETLEEFGADAAVRHSVRPGLTGLAQVNGNVLLSWKERLMFDMDYVRHCSLLLDVKILVRTVAVILFGEAWGKR